MSETTPWMSCRDLAATMGVSHQTVLNRVADGAVYDGHRFEKRKVRPEDDVPGQTKHVFRAIAQAVPEFRELGEAPDPSPAFEYADEAMDPHAADHTIDVDERLAEIGTPATATERDLVELVRDLQAELAAIEIAATDSSSANLEEEEVLAQELAAREDQVERLLQERDELAGVVDDYQELQERADELQSKVTRLEAEVRDFEAHGVDHSNTVANQKVDLERLRRERDSWRKQALDAHHADADLKAIENVAEGLRAKVTRLEERLEHLQANPEDAIRWYCLNHGLALAPMHVLHLWAEHLGFEWTEANDPLRLSGRYRQPPILNRWAETNPFSRFFFADPLDFGAETSGTVREAVWLGDRYVWADELDSVARPEVDVPRPRPHIRDDYPWPLQRLATVARRKAGQLQMRLLRRVINGGR